MSRKTPTPSPKTQALLALGNVLNRLVLLDAPMDGLDLAVLKAAVGYAVERVGAIQEVQRVRRPRVISQEDREKTDDQFWQSIARAEGLPT